MTGRDRITETGTHKDKNEITTDNRQNGQLDILPNSVSGHIASID